MNQIYNRSLLPWTHIGDIDGDYAEREGRAAGLECKHPLVRVCEHGVGADETVHVVPAARPVSVAAVGVDFCVRGMGMRLNRYTSHACG